MTIGQLLEEHYSNYAFAHLTEAEMKSIPDFPKEYKQPTLQENHQMNSMADELEVDYQRSWFSETYYKLYPVTRVFKVIPL